MLIDVVVLWLFDTVPRRPDTPAPYPARNEARSITIIGFVDILWVQRFLFTFGYKLGIIYLSREMSLLKE